MKSCFDSLFSIRCLVICFLLGIAPPALAEPVNPYPLIDWPMDHVQGMERREEITRFAPRLIDLWLAALTQPDAETRRKAVDAISAAHAKGMAALEERTGNRLMQLVRDRQEHRAVRIAAARALSQMDVPRGADILMRANLEGDVEMILITDPPLAKWKHQPSIEMWLKRLEDPNLSATVLRSALQALAAASEMRAVKSIKAMVLDKQRPPTIRLSAAAALSKLVSSGLETMARDLLDSPTATLIDRLAASTVLRKHKSKSAHAILLSLIHDRQAVVVIRAVEPLLAIDATLLWPSIDALMASDDANVRRAAIRVLDGVRSKQAFRLLVAMLSDPDPQLRAAARFTLHDADGDEKLSPMVRAALMAELQEDSPLGKPQCAVLLGRLKHGPAMAYLQKMTRDLRPLDRLAAVVALRWMDDPSVLPLAFERTREVIQEWPRNRRNARVQAYHIELSQLIQLLGALDSQDEQVDRFLRRFIPREALIYSQRARAAAIWSLGKIHHGKQDKELAIKLLGRVLDMRIGFGEDPLVRKHAALALGQLDVADLVVSSRSQTVGEIMFSLARQGQDVLDVQLSYRWAARRLSSRPLPPLRPSFANNRSQFLAPVGDPR